MSTPEEIIRKLLSLAQGGTEHEAQLAAQKASEIALKYGIDLLAFQTSKSDYQDKDFSDVKVDQWVSNILAGVCLVNAVKYYRAANIEGWTYRLIGKEHATASAKAITEYLIQAIKRLQGEAIRRHGLSQQERSQYRKSFRLGASQRLYQRFLEQYVEMRTTNNPATGNNALVVADYFDQSSREIEEFIEQANLGLTRTASRTIAIRSHDGYFEGVTAGNQISLNTQVDNGSNSILRIN